MEFAGKMRLRVHAVDCWRIQQPQSVTKSPSGKRRNTTLRVAVIGGAAAIARIILKARSGGRGFGADWGGTFSCAHWREQHKNLGKTPPD